MNKYCTVDEAIEKLKKASADGHGDKIVTINNEYYFETKESEYRIVEGCVDFSDYLVK